MDNQGKIGFLFLVKGGKFFYFDSYDGNEIYGNENWKQFLTRKWNRNKIELQQSDSDVCGDCLFLEKNELHGST